MRKKRYSVEDNINLVTLVPRVSIGVSGSLIHAFGIRVHDGSIAPFSKIGDSYPAERSYIFSTQVDYQEQITLEFHLSSKPMAGQDSYLATVEIRGFEPARAEEPLIRVHYRLSEGQIVVWATDENSNAALRVNVIEGKAGRHVH